MAESLVLINGLPGAGKSTLARPLSQALRATSLGKDAVKEALADVTPAALHGFLGGIAMDTVWRLAAQAPGRVVVDSWWFRPRDEVFARVGIGIVGAAQVVEVWCDVPVDVARARYEARVRHAVHDRGSAMDQEWSAWGASGVPLAVGPVVCVDTTATVDVKSLARDVARLLG